MFWTMVTWLIMLLRKIVPWLVTLMLLIISIWVVRANLANVGIMSRDANGTNGRWPNDTKIIRNMIRKKLIRLTMAKWLAKLMVQTIAT